MAGSGGITDLNKLALGTVKSFNYDTVIGDLGKSVNEQEKALQDLMSKIQTSKNPSPAALAAMQYQINKWSLNFNMYSSMIKSIKDISAGIIQKI